MAVVRRAAKFAVFAAAGLIGFLLIATTLLVVFANTAPGRRAVEAVVAKVMGGEVTIRGLDGRFPDRLRATAVTLHGFGGVFGQFDDVVLEWSASDLLFGKLTIERLAAARAAVDRVGASGGNGSSLPLRSLRIADLEIGRLSLAPSVAGLPVTLRLHGHLEISSPQSGSAALDAQRLDAAGSYRADLRLTPSHVTGVLSAHEPGQGLIGHLMGLPDLGSLALDARIDGPRTAAATGITLVAGPLRAKATGTMDLARRSVDLKMAGTAPAMAPRPGLSWQGVQLDAHVAGPLERVDATGHLDIDRLTAYGGSVRKVAFDIAATTGTLVMNGELSGLVVPGPKPKLFAAAPVKLKAEAMLQQPTWPVRFSLTAPSLAAEGSATLKGAVGGKIALHLTSLAPVAALTAVDLEGSATIHASFAARDGGYGFKAQGDASVTGGATQMVGLLGPNAKFAIDGLLKGGDVDVTGASVNGRTLRASLQGALKAGRLDFDYAASLLDLAVLAPDVTGAVDIKGRVEGPETDFGLDADIRGRLGARAIAEGPIEASLEARGLPAAPNLRIKASGTVGGAPLRLDAAAARLGQGGLQITIENAQWKSAHADGRLVLGGGRTLPAGRLQLRMGRLKDVAPFLGVELAGQLSASVDAAPGTGAARGKGELVLDGEVRRFGFGGGSIGRLTLSGRILDPLSRRVLALRLDANDIDVNGVSGRARMTADGPVQALVLKLELDAATRVGPARLDAAATLELAQRRLHFSALQASVHDVAARLLAPATLDFGRGLALHQFRLGVDKGVIEANGRVSSPLDLRLSAHDIDPALARIFLPGLDVRGSISGDGTISGRWAALDGAAQIKATGLRVVEASGAGLPPADLSATVKLATGTATLDAVLSEGGANQLALRGKAVLRANGALDLQTTGTLDLALFNTFLAAGGRTAKGRLVLDSRIDGTWSRPLVQGRAELADGAFLDYVRGLRVSGVNGLCELSGDTLRIVRLSGKAGSGTISVDGTLGLTSGLPVSLAITMKNAEPVMTDLLTATVDADITVQGSLQSRLNVGGSIHVDRARINIPTSFPASVAVLDVSAPGKPVAPSPRLALDLDLAIDAPSGIAVRGHGLGAEMGGKLRISGPSEHPQITGGFKLVRGDIKIVSQTLQLTKGTVTFSPDNLAGRLDPVLDFAAQTTVNSVTATIALAGYADHPTITLSSSPSLPQSEVLSLLLFGQETARLSAVQAAQLAQAVASLSGGGGFDPLAALRDDLGLDRFTVSAGATATSMPTVEAGKRITQDIYVGAKQGKLGNTQAQVEINLTKNLKLSTTVGTGGDASTTGASPAPDIGSSVGLTYEFEY